MEYVALGKLCDVRDGTHDSPKYMTEGYPLVTSKNVSSGKIDFSDCNYISEEDFVKICKRSKVDIGDIIMPMIGTVGQPVVVDIDIDFAIKNVALIKFQPESKVTNEYIALLLNSPYFDRVVLSKVRGGTQKFISLKDIREFPIPLVSLDKQNYIVKTLKNVKGLIDMRYAEIQKLDELIKSRFVEMFGDKGYPVLKWNDVFNTKTGKLDSNAAVENGQYPFFTCSKEALWIDNFAFDQEALLLAGNNAAGKYDVKHYKGKFNAYQRTYVLSLKNDWSYQLFRYQLEDKLLYLQQQSLGGLTKYLTMKILGELDFIIPPVEKQVEFENFVQQVDKSKVVVQEALDKAQLLFDSLMQEYFG